MTVLKATQHQYENLNGFRNGNSVLLFAKDANDNWIVGKAVLEDEAFAEIREDLQHLEEILYEPIETEL